MTTVSYKAAIHPDKVNAQTRKVNKADMRTAKGQLL